ncbi:MAG: GrdX family protein [Symbiobacteriaceae bacterium]|nr:GrdX family protein [Symbiobacteriaceae bacterium]
MLTISKLLIITNNSQVTPLEGAIYFNEDLEQILTRVRNLVHQNHILITHPLAGSVKPHITPYKSVAVSATPGAQLDYPSLQIIENALQLTRQLKGNREPPSWSSEVLADFATIDFSLLQSGLESLKYR